MRGGSTAAERHGNAEQTPAKPSNKQVARNLRCILDSHGLQFTRMLRAQILHNQTQSFFLSYAQHKKPRPGDGAVFAICNTKQTSACVVASPSTAHTLPLPASGYAQGMSFVLPVSPPQERRLDSSPLRFMMNPTYERDAGFKYRKVFTRRSVGRCILRDSGVRCLISARGWPKPSRGVSSCALFLRSYWWPHDSHSTAEPCTSPKFCIEDPPGSECRAAPRNQIHRKI
jgi:hypothetical protein